MSRPPLRGYNHNIYYRKRVYHVQTEDSGLTNPHIFTHVFHKGVILCSSRGQYKDIVNEEGHEEKVRKMMQAQHKQLMKQLRRGELDDKIVLYLKSLEGEETGKAPTGAQAVVEDETAEVSVPIIDDASVIVDRPPTDDGIAEPAVAAEVAAEPDAPAETKWNEAEDETDEGHIVNLPPGSLAPSAMAQFRPSQAHPVQPAAEKRPAPSPAVPSDVKSEPGVKHQSGVYKILREPPPQQRRPIHPRQDAPAFVRPVQASTPQRYTAPSAKRMARPGVRPGAPPVAGDRAARATGAYLQSGAHKQPVAPGRPVMPQQPAVVATPPLIISNKAPKPSGQIPSVWAQDENQPAPPQRPTGVSRVRPPSRQQPRQAPSNLFGEETNNERSLDEVILQYLSDDESKKD